jgi:hypothetical protein
MRNNKKPQNKSPGNVKISINILTMRGGGIGFPQ